MDWINIHLHQETDSVEDSLKDTQHRLFNACNAIETGIFRVGTRRKFEERVLRLHWNTDPHYLTRGGKRFCLLEVMVGSTEFEPLTSWM